MLSYSWNSNSINSSYDNMEISTKRYKSGDYKIDKDIKSSKVRSSIEIVKSLKLNVDRGIISEK